MIIIIIVITAILGGIIVATIKNNKTISELVENDKKRKKDKNKKKEEYLIVLEKQKKMEREKKLNNLTALMSSPNKIIEYEYNHFIMVNESTSQILLNEQIYNFKDIINYTVSDNTTVIQKHSGGRITSISSTNTGSMVGRTLVGGVLAGGVGAAIGGATAKRESTSSVAPSSTTSSTIHNYMISVTVNNISNPIERLELGEDELITNEICALLSVIISRNK